MLKKNNKLKPATGGYISVDRKDALRKNWPAIQKMSRPKELWFVPEDFEVAFGITEKSILKDVWRVICVRAAEAANAKFSRQK